MNLESKKFRSHFPTSLICVVTEEPEGCSYPYQGRYQGNIVNTKWQKDSTDNGLIYE